MTKLVSLNSTQCLSNNLSQNNNRNPAMTITASDSSATKSTDDSLDQIDIINRKFSNIK